LEGCEDSKAFAQQRKISIYVEKHQQNHEYIIMKENWHEKILQNEMHLVVTGYAKYAAVAIVPTVKERSDP
jgi:hypothetical protein